MNTYQIIETIYYYVDAENMDAAWDKFDSSNFDKADASKVYRELNLVKGIEKCQ